MAAAPTVRPPAVAGMFYPRSAVELEGEVRACLEAAGAPASAAAPKALIVPHAGYRYSGPIAGSAFARLAGAAGIERVVVIGPAHRVYLAGLALPAAGAFSTPLGEVPLAPEPVRRAAALPQVAVSAEAHREEHALEVELPFLQVVLGDFELVPLVVGDASPAEVGEVLAAVWGGPETLVVVSSDLSHYLDYETAAQRDRRTAERILALDAGLRPHDACGAGAVNGLLVAARERSLAAELLDLRSSGDTAGDRARVVGYGAFAFDANGAA